MTEPYSPAKRYIAEFIGTFLLLLFGGGVVVASEFYAAQANLLGISLTWGILVGTLVYIFGPISGTHINPSVTLSLWLARKFDSKDVLPYLLAQCAGAILGALALKALFFADGGISTTFLCSTHPSGSLLQSFVFEVAMTGMLLFTVMALGAQAASQGQAALTIAGLITLLVFVGGPISGASLNPARSLGPALVSGNLEHLWLYLTAPVLGGILGTFGYLFLFTPETAAQPVLNTALDMAEEEVSAITPMP